MGFAIREKNESREGKAVSFMKESHNAKLGIVQAPHDLACNLSLVRLLCVWRLWLEFLRRVPMKKQYLSIIVLVLLVSASQATFAQQRKQDRLPPDLMNVQYGPHERNVLDVWKAKAKTPTPVLVFFHGGGFRQGDKSKIQPQLMLACLDQGISVVSANYRLSDVAHYPAQMHDGARAVQFVRHKAKDFNIDPERIAVCGGSAGAGLSLWIAFHDDLADPESDDPVCQQSSRVSCVASIAGQSSYDPFFINENMGFDIMAHPALFPFYGLNEGDEIDTPSTREMFRDASAINHATADDPPSFLFYAGAKTPPTTDDIGHAVHHIMFGEILKQKMDPLGVECIVRHISDYAHSGRVSLYLEMVGFFLSNFHKDEETVDTEEEIENEKEVAE